MMINEAKDNFLKQYKCVHISELLNVDEKIKNFDGGAYGKGITVFLKKQAMQLENTGGSRGYLVVDKNSDDVFANYLMKAKIIVEAKHDKSFHVYTTYPAIEVENLCKNVGIDFKYEFPLPLSFFVFWLFIVPRIFDTAKNVGCEYVYLFAADRAISEEEKADNYKLVEHYRKYFKFHNMMELRVVKPHYDLPCVEMVQSYKDLSDNAAAIWEEFTEG